MWKSWKLSSLTGVSDCVLVRALINAAHQ